MTRERRQAWALVFVATLTMAVSYVDRQVLAVLAPTVTRALAIDETSYGLLAGAFSLAYLVGAPLSGRLIDRFGARRGLVGAVVVWSLVSAAHALAPGFGTLFALRIALGLSESPSFPGATQTVHRALPPEERARGIGILFTGSSLGAIVAAPLATAVEARFGWRGAMLVTALVGLVWLPLWFAVAWSGFGRARLDVRPAAPSHERTSFLDMLRHRAVLRATLLVIGSSPIVAFALIWASKYLVTTHGLTQAAVGRLLWLPPLGFDLGAVLFGDRAARLRSRSAPRSLVAVAAVFALSLALVPLAKTPLVAVALVSVAVFGSGGLYALLTGDMLARVPSSCVSVAGGCTAAAQALASVVVNPLIGKSVQATGSYTTALLALAALLVPCVVGWLAWPDAPRQDGVGA
jgi:ACS family hexuronate transporter-like MFS transporter